MTDRKRGVLESFKNSEISIVSFWETEKNIIQFFCSRTSILRQNAVLEKKRMIGFDTKWDEERVGIPWLLKYRAIFDILKNQQVFDHLF